MKACGFSPGHITGFFQICDESEDPLKKGSRGAGVSVDKGVTSTVEVEPAKDMHIHIEMNGSTSHPVPVSEAVITRMLEFVPGKTFDIRIKHEVALPVGCGFGTSGAGALSLSLALNEALNLGLNSIKVAQIAHVVEVDLHTGLGTVIAETFGGIEIRIQEGAPGIGQIMILPSSDDYMVVCLPFGALSTPQYLQNDEARQRINERGGMLTDALQGHPTVGNFLDYSRHFAEYIGIITDRVQAVLQATDLTGITCSTAIFGENVFTLALPDQVKEIVAIFEEHKTPEHDVLIMNVDWEGARVMNE
ncbi:MAG: pantoate kinase [Candidatus Hermodarchaeota archaeon]